VLLLAVPMPEPGAELLNNRTAFIFSSSRFVSLPDEGVTTLNALGTVHCLQDGE
jgi:hypothetical protein